MQKVFEGGCARIGSASACVKIVDEKDYKKLQSLLNGYVFVTLNTIPTALCSDMFVMTPLYLVQYREKLLCFDQSYCSWQ